MKARALIEGESAKSFLLRKVSYRIFFEYFYGNGHKFQQLDIAVPRAIIRDLHGPSLRKCIIDYAKDQVGRGVVPCPGWMLDAERGEPGNTIWDCVVKVAAPRRVQEGESIKSFARYLRKQNIGDGDSLDILCRVLGREDEFPAVASVLRYAPVFKARLLGEFTSLKSLTPDTQDVYEADGTARLMRTLIRRRLGMEPFDAFELDTTAEERA